MKIILGLNAFHADTSACIIKDNHIVAAIEEERITRIKHCSDFPINAIKECLKIAKINFEDITDISINSDPSKNLKVKIFHFIKNFQIKKINNLFFKRLKNKLNLKNYLSEHFKINKLLKIHNVEHHLAHLASSFYASEFNNATGLSIDGSGDFVSLAIAECSETKIDIKKRLFFPNSLGLFYQGITQFIGFNNYGDEYKLMGLAPYGKPIYFDQIKSKLFIKKKNFYELNLDYFNHHKLDFNYDISESIKIDSILSKKFEKFFERNLTDKDNIEKFYQDIASSTQKLFEHFLNIALKDVVEKNFSKNLVYAGGCALNSSANNILLSNKSFKNIFIPFAPSDNGGSIGSALLTNHKHGNKIIETKSPYLGNDYTNEEIEQILLNIKDKKQIKIEKIDNFNLLCDEAVNQLINDSVIGWFQGKMEFGPRALGNRSILADPRKRNMKNIINNKIKRRENFRPFAPSVMKEHQNEWFEENYDNLYMSSVMNAKKDKIKLIPAVVHVDGTSRVQTVSEKMNFRFYNLINKFYKKTTVPMLLNTSFNENEPIVRRPDEAIKCFLRTDMDALFINDFYIKKIK